MFQQNREKKSKRDRQQKQESTHTCVQEEKEETQTWGVFFELLVKYLISRKQKLFKQTTHSVLQADNLEKVLCAKAKGLTTNKKAER